MATAQDSTKKRKKNVYKESDEVDATPAKRFKPSSAAEDIPDLTTNEVLYDSPTKPLQNKKKKLPKKKKQIKPPKAKSEVDVPKTSNSPLLLILFGAIRKCRQDKRDAKTTATIATKINKIGHSRYLSYFKVEVSTSAEIYQDDVDRIVALLNSNVNETTFANLDRTIQVKTVERSSGIQKEWILTEDSASSTWQTKQSRSPIEPHKDLPSIITLFLIGDVYGEFYTIEPVLEECLLFNPFIAFNYQLDKNPVVVLRGTVEYKPQAFKTSILSNITSYYAPEHKVVKNAGKLGKSQLHVLINCQSDASITRSFIEVKILQDGLVALPTKHIVEQLLNKNWDGDHGIGIELDEMIVADVPLGYYIRTSAGELSTISNILVILEHNVPCRPFDIDRAIVVGSSMVTALIESLKELKETKIELASKREMAKLQDFQIATDDLTESISSIIEISTNAEFVEKCMQRLEVDNIEDLRPALQQMIEKSVEKFMPRATVNALNQN